MIKKYLKAWYLMSRNSFASAFHSKLSFFIFLAGKIVRFVFFTLFLLFLIKGIDSLAGYNLNQTIFIFLTFNIVDIVGQFLYREVYRFKPLIVNGDFDLILVKPISSLFRSLMGGADFIDLVTIPALFVFTYIIGAKLDPSLTQVFYYFVLLINGLIITTAFHILILASYVRFFELDYVLWLYRDLLNLGKLPVEVYKQPLRSILTYMIPVATMITVPVKAMIGLVSFWGIVASLLIGLLLLTFSVRVWNGALKFYSSASS